MFVRCHWMQKVEEEVELGYVGHEAEKSDFAIRNWCLQKQVDENGRTRWLVDEDDGGGDEVRHMVN